MKRIYEWGLALVAVLALLSVANVGAKPVITDKLYGEMITWAVCINMYNSNTDKRKIRILTDKIKDRLNKYDLLVYQSESANRTFNEIAYKASKYPRIFKLNCDLYSVEKV